MVGINYTSAISQLQSENAAQGLRSLSFGSNERMAGSIPVFSDYVSSTSMDDIEEKVKSALSGEEGSSSIALNDSSETSSITVNEDESYSFWDVLDIVNPLQHIPIVSSIYREITGDEIKPTSKIIGGAVFGGVIGAVGGVIDAVVESETGKDVFGNINSFAFSDSNQNSKSSENCNQIADSNLLSPQTRMFFNE